MLAIFYLRVNNRYHEQILDILLQGLPPSEFVECHQLDGKAVGRYVPSEHCSRTQRAFLQLHGGAKNTKKSKLPRRQESKPSENAEASSERLSMVGLKRQRRAQLEVLQPNADVSDLGELSAAAAQSAADRRGEKYEKLTRLLQTDVASLRTRTAVKRRKKRQFQEDAQPFGVRTQTTKKLREHQRRESSIKADLERKQLFELPGQPSLDACSVCAVACAAEDARVLEALRLKVEVWENSKEQFQRFRGCQLLWFASSYELELGMTVGPEQNRHMTAVLLATRLLGGFIGTPRWLEACTSEGRLVQPVLQLRCTLSIATEICFHKSLKDEADLECAAAIARCLEGATLARKPAAWQLRSSWKDVQKKECLVLVGDAVASKPEGLKELAAKAAKEAKIGIPAGMLHFFHQRTQWIEP
ncbi:unnamed protein product [Symbiodinium sp. CCMP2592]|nr:unnamed protein product [Symbiodinium sp. CCMP2592]CAE7599948.1 unnamed protein product [Symbiodinium sp. CCMP2592]